MACVPDLDCVGCAGEADEFQSGQLMMSMPYDRPSRSYPLVAPYPLCERAHHPREVALAEAMGKPLALPETCASPTELGTRVAQYRWGGFQWALEEALKADPAYRAARSQAPFLNQVPAIWAYRNRYGQHDENAVDREIRHHAQNPSMGQVVFRADRWPDAHGPYVGQSIVYSRAMSTTLVPWVAASHCGKHGDEAWLMILTVASDALPTFVYDIAKNQTLAHEFEIVFARDVRVTCTAVHEDYSIRTIEARLE